MEFDITDPPTLLIIAISIIFLFFLNEGFPNKARSSGYVLTVGNILQQLHIQNRHFEPRTALIKVQIIV